jgi:hypothetical protein
MPRTSSKFNKFPIPKYRRIRKIVDAVANIIPRLELAKIVESVNSSAKNTMPKKMGNAPRNSGSTE